MDKNPVKTVMSAVVLLIAFTFLYVFITTAEVGTVQGYDVKAIFTKVGGLQPGSDVRINGIKVGTASQLTLDPETYKAVVILTIKSDVELPEDTVATIGSEERGGKYVRLKPGKSKKGLTADATIDRTEGYISLEDQLDEISFQATSGDRF